MLVALVTALSGLMGQVRGLLVARDRYAAVATVLVAENALRCLAAVVLVAVDAREPAAYGVALLVGYAACLLWPSTWLAAGERRGPAVGGLPQRARPGGSWSARRCSPAVRWCWHWPEGRRAR